MAVPHPGSRGHGEEHRCHRPPPPPLNRVLWAFCKHWIWQVLENSITLEGYHREDMTEAQARNAIREAIKSNSWPHNPAVKLAILYLIGKGKSLRKGRWLWCGIIALPQPLLPKPELRIAARANTTFLRVLLREIHCVFITQEVNDVSRWFHSLSTIQ